jgi:hypothetical protein
MVKEDNGEHGPLAMRPQMAQCDGMPDFDLPANRSIPL